MPDIQLPSLQLPTVNLPSMPDGWAYFATWQDGIFSIVSLLLIILLIIWWRQQSSRWLRVSLSSFLGALLLCIGSFYLFRVEPYTVGCTELCTGWRGFPRAIALVTPEQVIYVGPIDFASNLLLIWLIGLTVTVIWRILLLTIDWQQRSLRTKTLCFLAVWILPWAILPRFLSPPQPVVTGENLRIATNALRVAEFTYNITGLWVQRLALEDIRVAEGIDTALPIPDGNTNENIAAKQVCLRGYTYFYIPWRRYRIILEPTSVSSVQMRTIGLNESCWVQ